MEKKPWWLRAAVFLARLGDRLISAVAALLVLVMLLYGGYSLWDTAMVYSGAFTSSDLLQYKPSEDSEDGATLADLAKINPDVLGWITVDDTNIDYPVLQGEDDLEYINKDVYGEFALSGSIFLDSRNSRDFTDPYSLIYGHHMSNGAMFGNIVDFTDKNYFDAHRTGTLYLVDGGEYTITLFACVETDAYDATIYQTEIYAETEVASLLSYIGENAVQYRDIGVQPEDRLLALSTCAEAETNGRVIVFGRLEE